MKDSESNHLRDNKYMAYSKNVVYAYVLLIKNVPLLVTGYVAFTIAIAMSLSLTLIMTEKLIRCVINYMSDGTSVTGILLYGLFLTAILIFTALQECGKNFFNIRLEQKLIEFIAPMVIEKIKKVEYFCFEDKQYIDIFTRLGDEPHVYIRDVFINTLSVVQLVLSVLFVSFVYVKVSVWLIALLCMVLAFSFWIYLQTSLIQHKTENDQVINERKLNYWRDLLSQKKSMFELKVANNFTYFLSKTTSFSKHLTKIHLKIHVKNQKYFLFKSLFTFLWYGISLILTSRALLVGKIDISFYIVAVSSFHNVLAKLDELAKSFVGITSNILMVGVFKSFLSMPIQNPGDKKLWGEDYTITFENVSFAYPGTETLILKNISFSIYPLDFVAIVGENGAGKSTLVKLLCGLYEPTSGRITINGIDIKEISYDQHRKKIFVVFQNYTNFTLTLRENIQFGNIDMNTPDDILLSAILKGNLLELLELDKRLDTNLGKLEDNGVDLSVGQWQKIAIARTFLSNADFIILDEPTAALDPIAESEMYSSFMKIQKDRGIIMISHRLASAKNAKTILVLHEGRIDEQGNHENLMKKGGRYFEMFQKQAFWYKS
jgi:ABC-type multidrug transport system fused ATPase/permease subunit